MRTSTWAGETRTGRSRPARRKQRKKRSEAKRADRYALYQEAVQDPEGDVARVGRMFARERNRPARTLREDFCGTAAFTCAWAAAHGENRAVGVDLDPDPLDWGRRHNVAALRPEQAARVELVEGDVRTTRTRPVDLLVAFNFSYYCFETRAELIAYFRHARRQLTRDGILVLDAYGGPEAQERREEKREYDDFTYVWDQDTFDPITHHSRCYIHFEFGDGSRLKRAFSYTWRLWSLPELRDALAEAGFSKTVVYWEGTEKGTNEPNGVYRPRNHAEDDPAWVSYLVCVPD
ncbi:MAG: class I SAM-dependent methyltransferase [Myxococcota bacterium]|nr:class I SAM-dependent methyltransferase [Myxococcota bacterium]